MTLTAGATVKKIAARVRAIKEQEEMEWRRCRAAHRRHEIEVK